MIATLHTPICGLLGCDYPVVWAGIDGTAGSERVAAVCEAGGFGLLGMVHDPVDLIRADIAQVRAATTRDFGVSLISAATDPKLLEAGLRVVIAERVAAVALLWDLRHEIVRRLRDAGCLVLCQVGSAREGEEATAAGAHILIAQGLEAGGHGRGMSRLIDLVPDVVARTDLPVLAAGGIADGKGLAAALTLGAEGVVVGTDFLAAHEPCTQRYCTNHIVEARPGETIHTDPFRTLAAERRIIGVQEERPIDLFSMASPPRNMAGDFAAMAARLSAIAVEASRILGIAEEVRPGTIFAIDVSSPACFANEADDAYMGYADKDELVEFLNELLEAKRAGARVALRTALAADVGVIAVAMRTIHKDEARWCAMLLRQIKALGRPASPRVGPFYGQAMAIADVGERIASFNRNQSGIAQRLREMLPRIRDNALHADLADMLRSHETSIASTDELWD